jgi:predicted ATPase
MLKEISIHNFKSLRNVTVRVGPLAFFCGPNASGKTNLAEAFDFLSHVFLSGLANAVAEKGGFYNMCYRRIRRTKGAISFRITGETKLLRDISVKYDFSFSFKTHSEAIRSQFVVEDETYKFHVYRNERPEETADLSVVRDQARFYAHGTGSLFSEPSSFFGFDTIDKLNELLSGGYKARPQQLLINPTSGFLYEIFDNPARLQRELDGLRVFQMNPRIARQPGTPSVSEGLGRHGENLPIVVESFLRQKTLAPRLISWMQDILPQLEGILTEYTDSKQIGLYIQEHGFGAPWYAEDVSDGTIMALGLFIALLDPDHRIIVIEEPENSLHPWILKRFLEHCREVSQDRQVLITTHSPLVVSGANPNELFLIERSDGVTEVIPAEDREPYLPQIVKREMLDLGEYWLSGGLGGVPEPPTLPLDELVQRKSNGE